MSYGIVPESSSCFSRDFIFTFGLDKFNLSAVSGVVLVGRRFMWYAEIWREEGSLAVTFERISSFYKLDY